MVPGSGLILCKRSGRRYQLVEEDIHITVYSGQPPGSLAPTSRTVDKKSCENQTNLASFSPLLRVVTPTIVRNLIC